MVRFFYESDVTFPNLYYICVNTKLLQNPKLSLLPHSNKFTFYFSDYDARLSKVDKEERELMNPAIERATNALKFVAQHVKNEDNFNSYADDWKYVAMVLDRILLWMFTIACVVGK